MKITPIRSDRIYKEMVLAKPEERDDLYRYKLMKPFEFKWKCIGIPLESGQDGGRDVVSVSGMSGGYSPSQITGDRLEEIERISDDSFWDTCADTISTALESFSGHGIALPVQDYVFTVLLNDPHSPVSALTGDYCGDGGIPGYIFGTIIPNEKSRKMLPVALAHETNHNVRWQFMKWDNSITLRDMIVSEGLAENFAAGMFGEDKIGIWVSTTTADTLQAVIKPAIKANLNENDFMKLSSYLYGDEIMAMRGAAPVGMPYCGGYACGYHLIQYYLKKSRKNIYQATVTPAEEILKEAEGFWNER